MIKNFIPRIYQQSIFSEATKQNTLVVLPTGLGKTGIALMMIVHRLNMYPDSKILFVAPTKPLVEQHIKTLKKHLPEKKFVALSGTIKPEKRAVLWEENQIIISTPQGIQNDVITNRISLKKVSLLIFDEAHRATGDYSYVYLGHKYAKEAIKERILALTASPGTDKIGIDEVINNLHIDKIEVRNEEDYDVKQYVQEKEIIWVEVILPEEFNSIIKNLRALVKSKLQEIVDFGFYKDSLNKVSKKNLLRLTAELRSRMSSGEKSFEIMKSLSLVAEIMKAEHSLELIETQGITSLNAYFQEIQSQANRKASKAVQNLINNSYFKAAVYLTDELKLKNVEHPKLKKLLFLIKKDFSQNKKIIIFNQFRDQAIKIKGALDKEKIASELFFGQAKKKGKGLSQKEQKAMIEDFEKGKFQVLIATSVAEEGLDIPSVDKVIFYEPIPSAIRTVQRRGRTGRQKKGTVIVLLAKNTRDEAYKWSAHHKEKRMYSVIKEFKAKHQLRKEKTLDSYKTTNNFDMDKPPISELLIIIDHRERHSAIVKELSHQEINIELHKLEIGDYLLSENVIVEFKTQQDFVNSIIDGRLLEQAVNLRKYSKPLIIIEGTEDLFSQRNIHPNAIRGMLATLALQFKIPIVYTKNPKDTANLLIVIAKQEQEKKPKTEILHSIKPKTDKEMQEYIVASLPGIGIALAKPLLEEFKTIKKLFMASQERLEKVKLIGKKKAKRIRDVLDKDY